MPRLGNISPNLAYVSVPLDFRPRNLNAKYSTVQLLLEAGTEVDANIPNTLVSPPNPAGVMTPLMTAASRPTLIWLTIAELWRKRETAKHGFAIRHAAGAGDADMVKLLIDSGANVNAQAWGQNPPGPPIKDATTRADTLR